MNFLINNSLLKKIQNVTSNSKEVTENSCFVAIKGLTIDGNNFIDEAIANGAKLIVTEQDYDLKSKEIDFLKVDNSRKALSFIASQIYYNQPKNIVTVTGTNGKTSVAYFFQQITKLLNYNSASMGTLGISLYKGNNKNLTTPDSTEIHKILDQLTKDGITHVCMEASSHGLHQHRLDFVNIKSAAFTNISLDHLDYHKSMDEYFKAKMILFKNVMKNGTAVINSDIEEYKIIKKLCNENHHKIISYGKSKESDLKIINYNNHFGKIDLQYQYENNIYNTTLNLVGDFQIYNVLCAVGLALSCNIDINHINRKLNKLTSPPGRMEIFSKDNKIVIVDFAHTPDALEKALTSLKAIVKNKLIVIFGCGGMRDKEKRPKMGSIACNLADIVIITDDNPRQENPSSIRSEIQSSCPKAINIADRLQAIKYAVDIMQDGDIVLIAGKGHENTQILKDRIINFDDREIIKELFL